MLAQRLPVLTTSHPALATVALEQTRGGKEVNDDSDDEDDKMQSKSALRRQNRLTVVRLRLQWQSSWQERTKGRARRERAAPCSELPNAPSDPVHSC